MNRFTADDSLQQSLTSFGGLTEIRDSQGNVIGFFSPVANQQADAYAQSAAHFDPEEMKRRKQSNEPGETTADVLKRLASLDK